MRDARPADLEAIEAVLRTLDDTGRWPGMSGYPYLAHVLERGRMLVEERDGRVAAFGATIDVGPVRHLADLFVERGLHGWGIGRGLLAELLGDHHPRSTFSSADPRALPLYTRAGMLPRWPLLYLMAPWAALGRLGPPPVTVAAGEPLGPVAAADLERRLTGIDRAADHAWWARPPGAETWAILVDDTVAGLVVGRDLRGAPGRWLERLVAAPGADATLVARAAIAIVTGAHGRLTARHSRLADDAGRLADARFGLAVPGIHPLLPALLEAGFRIEDRDTYCADEPTFDGARQLPDGGLL